MGFLLHHSIEESADRDPDREAFRFDGQAITYAGLVARANRLASVLIERGVKPRDRVGIYMNKSLNLPTAVFGILKAGAAYVPIDPVAPIARVALIVEDCGIRHLVTNASRAHRAAQVVARTPAIQCVVGGEAMPSSASATEWIPWATVDGAPSGHPDVSLVGEDLAYIMYTSGSTGVPKGLMHTHASGHSYATLSAREYGVVPEDRLGNHSPLHVDMSTFEYLTGPRSGATTVIIPEETTMFPMSLAGLIARERLTFWYSVPLALIQLLDRGGLENRDLGSLRWVLFGGEPFSPKHLARLIKLWPHARFSNSYGPAEVNQCTAFHLPPGRIRLEEPVPIGQVWPGAEGLVVDDTDRPVAPGEPGELLIHAPTMMRGYWARPDLNRRAFCRRTVRPGYDRVFYRTGDLVRERDDGNLVFLGRKDRQVKIRGYRVELEEVEAVMTSLPGVAEAAAVDLRDPSGDVTIVAAVRLRSGATVDATDLRRGAARTLSSYALPSRIDIRASLPRTGSGKIDRGAIRDKLVARQR